MVYYNGNRWSWRERMNVKRWMRSWQARFGSLGIEVMVADVAQSSVVVDVAGRTVILAPSLEVTAADRTLQKVYKWWQHRTDRVEGERCSLVSC